MRQDMLPFFVPKAIRSPPAFTRPFFTPYFFKIETSLLDKYNKKFILLVAQLLQIKTKIIYSSSLKSTGTSSDLILNICKELKAQKYISGLGAKDYLDIEQFSLANIEIGFLQSQNPVYKQFHGDFIPDLSILDMIMNVDRDIIKKYLNEEVIIETSI